MTLHNFATLHFNLQQKHWSNHNSFVRLMSNNPYIQVIFTTSGLLIITRKLSRGWRGRLLSPSGRPTWKREFETIHGKLNISNSLFDPRGGADSLEVLEKELAWFILLTLTNIYVEWRFRGILSYYLQILAAVEVDIVLPAVPGLVHVRKSRVKGDCLLQRVLNNLGHHRRMQKNSGNIEEIHLL